MKLRSDLLNDFLSYKEVDFNELGLIFQRIRHNDNVILHQKI